MQDARWGIEVKSLIKFFTADGLEFEEYEPADPRHFGVAIEIGFGDEGEGYSMYRIRVCSPSWFSEVASDNYFANGADFITGKGFLFLPEYVPSTVERIIQTFIEWASLDDWTIQTNRWSHLGNWESEDRMDLSFE